MCLHFKHWLSWEVVEVVGNIQVHTDNMVFTPQSRYHALGLMCWEVGIIV